MEEQENRNITEPVQETMDAMDLTGLVKAIQDLKTAVEPLTALGSLLKR